MKLYYLTRTKYVDWDETRSLVVRARTEEAARKIAAENGHGLEGGGVWLDSKLSTCEVLMARGDEGVVIIDYKAG